MFKNLLIVFSLCATTGLTRGESITTNILALVKPGSSSSEVVAEDDTDKRAAEWVSSLQLDDPVKAARVQQVVAVHLKNVRDWNNTHSYTNVPAGINPVTGKSLSTLDRQIIANSAQPKSYHDDLMAGLRRDMTEEQVEVVLDKYTIGKVPFTMRGYHAIVPDLTPVEETNILVFLKQAREQSIDYKGAKQMSVIFEIYKTKSEQYLNANGRNWHQLYGDYVKAAKAKKASTATNSPAQQP